MVRRRTVLRRSLGAIGVAGVGTLAGCQEELPGDEDGDDGADGDDGTESDGSDGAGTGPEWASWLYDPTTVGEVDAHGFTKYEVAELLSYRDQLPPDLDDGIERAFGSVDALSSDDVERVVGQGYLQLPDPEAEAGGSQPFGWNVVATGSFDAETVVGRLAETESYTDAGENEGFRLFEGPPDDSEFSAAVAVSADAMIGGGAFRYDLPITAPVERAIDADAGAADRYYPNHESAAALIDRHGDGTTVSGATDPDGSFEPFLDESPSAEEYEALLSSARSVGRSTTVGEETTTTQLSIGLSEPDPEAVGDLEAIVQRAQSQRGDREGPFSDPSVRSDGATLIVEASAETSRAMAVPSGLAVVAPEAAVAGTFVLNLGGPERDPAPQLAVSFDQRSDGRVGMTHDGGDRVERLVVQYATESGDRSQEAWTEPDGITAGDTYVTEAVPEPGSELLVVWIGPDQSNIVGQYEVPS